MIIANGSIRVVRSAGAYLDEKTGYPVVGEEQKSEPIRCQYYFSNYDALARNAGEPITKSEYIILIEANDKSFTVDTLELTDDFRGILGRFSVKSIEYLRAVGQFKIRAI